MQNRWHNWTFSLENGESRHLGSDAVQPVYPTRISHLDGKIEVGFDKLSDLLFDTNSMDF